MPLSVSVLCLCSPSLLRDNHVVCSDFFNFLIDLNRKVIVVNLDPANDILPYECGIDIASLVEVGEIIKHTKLGPNGALMYCMEYLEKNIDWLFQALKFYGNDTYVIFDCPGQVELYTHHDSVRNITSQLQKADYRLTAVNLIDSYYCTTPWLYISAVLTSLSTMLKMELPHVNVLSKIDQISNYGKLEFNLEFYTEVLDLTYLYQYFENDWFSKRYEKLHEAICQLIEEYKLVAFHTCNIQDKHSVYELLKVIDKSNGCVFGGLTAGNESIMACAMSDIGFQENHPTLVIQEKYVTEEANQSDN